MTSSERTPSLLDGSNESASPPRLLAPILRRMGEVLEDTVIIRIDNGVFVSSESTNPTLHRVAIIADGRRERLATVRRPVTEDQIAEAVRAINDCERMDAWNALDEARELVA
jgi:hypothetical protein